VSTSNDNPRTQAETQRLRALYGSDLPPDGEPEKRVEWLRKWAREVCESYADQALVGALDTERAKAFVNATIFEMANTARLDVGAADALAHQMWAASLANSLDRLEKIEKAIYWRVKRAASSQQLIAAAEAEMARMGGSWSSAQLAQIVLRVARSQRGQNGR
jgi:hypothetical protein